MTRIGVEAGLLGGNTIWAYELVVWVHLLHLRTVTGMFANSAVLAFGNRAKEWPDALAILASTIVHYAVAIACAVGFAWAWPRLRARDVEATLAALVYGILAWVVMHWVVLDYFSPAPPTYTVYSVLNGFVSHTFAFTVPAALWIKYRSARRPG